MRKKPNQPLNDLWRRFCQEAVAAGRFDRGELQNYPRKHRRQLMRRCMSARAGQWRFAVRTLSEAMILGCNRFEIKRPEPTNAPPGSREKVSVLISRAEAGEELFCDDDRNSLPDAPQAEYPRIYKNPETSIENGLDDMAEYIEPLGKVE